MDNLYLKNLKKIPNGYLILQKLYKEKQNNHNREPFELQEEITTYISNLTYKNQTIKQFISRFLDMLNDDTVIINERLDVIIRLITLLYKYKLNELSINSHVNFNKINNHIIKPTNLNAIKLINYESMSINCDKNIDSIIFNYELSFPYPEYYPNETKILNIIGSNNIITEIHVRSI
jgi:hypothetical protein